MRLGLTWIVSGLLLAVAVRPYAWRSNLPSPFNWVAGAGGLLLFIALVATAVSAWRNGSRLAMAGLILMFIGWLTAFFGGAVIALAGFALYPVGVARARIAAPGAVLAVCVALGAAVLAAYRLANPVASFELLACAEVAGGVALARSRRTPEAA